jgi:phosphoribosylaminoimidazole-succinocarboxamide synthase
MPIDASQFLTCRFPTAAVGRGLPHALIWSRYQKGIRQFDDLNLPDGMKKNEKLPKPVFDPTTKEGKHDRTLTPE